MTPAAVYQAQALVRLIASIRCDLSAEKRTQADIAAALDHAGIAYLRERRLSAGDVIDFLTLGGVGIEVKLKGARKKDVFRQLERYAAHDACQVLVLATSQTMGLPAEIGGKPAFYVSLGRGWM